MSYLLSFLLFTFLLFSSTLVYADDQPVINEFLVHPSSGNKEWVEFYIPDGIDISGYWIDDDTDFTDDTGSSAKRQITTLIQSSDSHHAVFELSSSIFNNDGDTVALFSPDGTLIDHYGYIKDPGVDISIGRTPDRIGDFQVLSSATPGSQNSAPQPTDTPTPAPTEKPTATLKPLPTTTPTKIKATSSSLVSASNTKSVLSDEITSSLMNKKTGVTTPSEISSKSAYPTSILGVSSQSAGKRTKHRTSTTVMVKGATSSFPHVMAFSIGGVLFLACGILVYLKKRGKSLKIK